MPRRDSDHLRWRAQKLRDLEPLISCEISLRIVQEMAAETERRAACQEAFDRLGLRILG